MSLYVTRHGETDYNVKDLVCGISEAKLTEKGIEQANRLAHSLQKINYKYLYNLIINSLNQYSYFNNSQLSV